MAEDGVRPKYRIASIPADGIGPEVGMLLFFSSMAGLRYR